MPWTDKEYDKKYHREYMRDLRAYWKSKGKCIECGKQDAYTMTGRAYCEPCLERKRIRESAKGARDLTRQNASAKARREERREAGFCTSCGRELPKEAGYEFVMCPSCRARDRIKAIRKYRAQGRIPKVEFVERGLCALCGKNKPADIQLAFIDRKTVLCESCYANVCAALRKGREVFAEMHGQSWGQMEFEYYERLREGMKTCEQKANERADS